MTENKRFKLKLGRFYDGEDILTNEEVLNTLNELNDENQELQMYKDSVSDVLLSWSQKNLTAKQLQLVIAIMEELNVSGLNE